MNWLKFRNFIIQEAFTCLVISKNTADNLIVDLPSLCFIIIPMLCSFDRHSKCNIFIVIFIVNSYRK